MPSNVKIEHIVVPTLKLLLGNIEVKWLTPRNGADEVRRQFVGAEVDILGHLLFSLHVHQCEIAGTCRRIVEFLRIFRFADPFLFISIFGHFLLSAPYLIFSCSL